MHTVTTTTGEANRSSALNFVHLKIANSINFYENKKALVV